MKTDRELLELAAKAAGIEIPDGCEFTSPDYWKHEATNTHIFWNPLHDDGDALRLAVKLNLVIGAVQPNCWAELPGHYPCYEPHGTDPYAATRRAIVRAAAQIGEKL